MTAGLRNAIGGAGIAAKEAMAAFHKDSGQDPEVAESRRVIITRLEKETRLGYNRAARAENVVEDDADAGVAKGEGEGEEGEEEEEEDVDFRCPVHFERTFEDEDEDEDEDYDDADDDEDGRGSGQTTSPDPGVRVGPGGQASLAALKYDGAAGASPQPEPEAGSPPDTARAQLVGTSSKSRAWPPNVFVPAPPSDDSPVPADVERSPVASTVRRLDL